MFYKTWRGFVHTKLGTTHYFLGIWDWKYLDSDKKGLLSSWKNVLKNPCSIYSRWKKVHVPYGEHRGSETPQGEGGVKYEKKIMRQWHLKFRTLFWNSKFEICALFRSAA